VKEQDCEAHDGTPRGRGDGGGGGVVDRLLPLFVGQQ